MKRNFYNAFYKKTGNILLSDIMAGFCYSLWLLYYCIQKFFKKNHRTVHLEEKEALECLERISPKPDITFTLKEHPVREGLDLTIIVPVYNYKDVLKQCLDSIQNQVTEYQYEMIFIDDGSTDGSEQVLKQYEADERITVCRQENSGISAARNRALNMAGGRYLMFVDCDDYLEPDAVELLLNRAYAADCDIVEGAYYTFESSLSKRRNYVQREVLLETQNDNRLMTYTGYPWAKVYKRELFERVRFPENAWFEDTLVKMILFRECTRYAYISDTVYGYRKYEGNYTETQVKSSRGLEHYWMLCWMAKLSDKNAIGSRESLYTAMLYHLGAIYRYRIESVEEEIQQAAFVAGGALLASIRLQKLQQKPPFMYRELEKAYQNKDFAWWKLICSCM